ncbi:MAG: hypothetical protein HRT63_11310 [Erythrobacter sp.]|nr:hypothetical protein [Erythrobacter sp.]
MKEAEVRACSAEGCGGTFVPCRYNGHKQTHCKACMEARRRMQQRNFAKVKYRNDAAYRERERERKRKSRQAAKTAELLAEKEKEAAAAARSLRAVTHVVTGLLAQFADVDDAEALTEHATALARRGRRLATAGCVVVGGHPKADVEEIFNPGFEAGRARPRRSL